MALSTILPIFALSSLGINLQISDITISLDSPSIAFLAAEICCNTSWHSRFAEIIFSIPRSWPMILLILFFVSSILDSSIEYTELECQEEE